MKNKMYQDLIISIGMIIMFAYGVLLGSTFGCAAYISVLFCGIIVFIFMIICYILGVYDNIGDKN